MEKFNEGICMAVDYSILESWNIDTPPCVYLLLYESIIERKRLTFLVSFPFRECRWIILETKDKNFLSITHLSLRSRYLVVSNSLARIEVCEMKIIAFLEAKFPRSGACGWPARDTRGGRRCIPHSPNSSVQWAVSWIRNDTRLLPAWKKKKKNRGFSLCEQRFVAQARRKRGDK